MIKVCKVCNLLFLQIMKPAKCAKCCHDSGSCHLVTRLVTR